MNVTPRSIFFATFAASAVLACSIALQTSEEQCTVDGDCARRGAAFAGTRCVNRVCAVDGTKIDSGSDAVVDATPTDPIWGCLGNVVVPPVVKNKVKVTIPFQELVQKTPVSDIQVRVCARLDVGCNNPVSPLQTPAADGKITFDVDATFDGFAEVVPLTPDGGSPNYVPSLVFFNPPPVDDHVYPTILLLSPETLNTVAIAAGSSVDPKLGSIFYAALNCEGTPGEGVSATPDRTESTTQGFYLIKGLPSLAASSTDTSGYGGIINTPLSFVKMSAVHFPTKRNIGTTTVLSRAGTITYVYLVPAPN
ncbi:hypothetical protein BH09MYX1_BH09MYX1_53480 [soil metagenome]